MLDFDDLLLYWKLVLEHGTVAESVRTSFDLVFVDEYQDTNALQGDVLRLLKPDGVGVTLVGDEAQSIYAFRGTSIENILGFPGQYECIATVAPISPVVRAALDRALARDSIGESPVIK